MQKFLTLGGRFEFVQHRLEAAHVLDAGGWNLSPPLHGPRLMDDLIRVVTNFLLQVRADRFGVAAHIALKRV